MRINESSILVIFVLKSPNSDSAKNFIFAQNHWYYCKDICLLEIGSNELEYNVEGFFFSDQLIFIIIFS